MAIHKEHKVYVAELIFGQLLTSDNYDDTEARVTGGRNGFGAKLTNIFSSHFEVECADSKRKQSVSRGLRCYVCMRHRKWSPLRIAHTKLLPHTSSFGCLRRYSVVVLCLCLFHLGTSSESWALVSFLSLGSFILCVFPCLLLPACLYLCFTLILSLFSCGSLSGCLRLSMSLLLVVVFLM